MDRDAMREAIRSFVEALELPAGEADAAACGDAVARAWAEDLVAGYVSDPREHLRVEFEDGPDDLVLVGDVPFVSLCSHHLLPFHGVAHVAYLPQGKLTGLSSITRVVEGYSRRLQSQERLARQIAEAVQEQLGAAGAACRIEATQLCVVGRGARRPGVRTVSECLLGALRDDPVQMRRFHALVGAAVGRGLAAGSSPGDGDDDPPAGGAGPA